MFGSNISGLGASVVDAFAVHNDAHPMLTSRHLQKEAYKQAVNDAWDNGNNTYAAAAKLRRQQRGTVVQQGITPSPLQPALSQLAYNSGGHASLALRPGQAPLPTSVNAPALAPNPNTPGLPQNPLGIEMGRGSSMYAKNIPNNGMPDLWSSTCLAQGEFAGTYKDPITGITYAMITEPVMEGVSERNVHAVYERNKPSRALETLTGVPASNLLVQQPKEQYAGPLAVIESQAPLPSQISEYVRARQTQAAVLQTFDASSTEQMYGLMEDEFKDGMLGTTYILRPRYDTQTLMDNDEGNTGVMNRFPIPNTDGSNIEFQDPSRSLETRPVFYMARPKPSLPSRTHLDLDDWQTVGPRQEVADRVGREMASLPSRTFVNIEDGGANPTRQDVHDRLPQGRDTVFTRAPDSVEHLSGFQLTRVPVISEQVSDSTAALAGRHAIQGIDAADTNGRVAQVSEFATARDAAVLKSGATLGGLETTSAGASRNGFQVREGDNGKDGRRAFVNQRIDVASGGDLFATRNWSIAADNNRGYDATVAASAARVPNSSEYAVQTRAVQSFDGGYTNADRAALYRQGAIQTENGFGVRQPFGVQESWNAGDHVAGMGTRLPDMDFGQQQPRAVAADADTAEDAKVLWTTQSLHGVENALAGRTAQVLETSRVNAGNTARASWHADMNGAFMTASASGMGGVVQDGGLGSYGQTAMPFALPRIDNLVPDSRAAAVFDVVGKEKAGSKPGAVMHVRPVLEDADNLGQVRVVFADSSRPDMANAVLGEHALHGFDLANALSQLKPAHFRDDYAPVQGDRHGLTIINPEIERDETNPANAIRDHLAQKAYLKSQEANAHKNPVMCMTRESYETDAYDTDG